jgi:hypothetical protein
MHSPTRYAAILVFDNHTQVAAISNSLHKLRNYALDRLATLDIEAIRIVRRVSVMHHRAGDIVWSHSNSRLSCPHLSAIPARDLLA